MTGIPRTSSTSVTCIISPLFDLAAEYLVRRREVVTGSSPFSALSVFDWSMPMILSESLTEETSGLVVTIALSA